MGKFSERKHYKFDFLQEILHSNQKKVVPSLPEKEMEMTNDLPDWNRIKFFIKGMGMKKVQQVPIRKVGLTGSGRLLDCHTNVSKLVYAYGGSDVRGYEVNIHRLDGEDVGISLNPHSVWKTPEGKLVDVSLNAQGKKEDYLYFIPVYENYHTDGYNFSSIQFLVPNDVRLPLVIDLDEENTIKCTRRDIKKKKVGLNLFWGQTKNSYFKEHPSKTEDGYENFSQPSTATGRYFNEMWDVSLFENPLQRTLLGSKRSA